MASRYLPFLTAVIMLAFGGGVAAAECPELYEQARKTRETGVSTAAAERCGALANKGDGTYTFKNRPISFTSTSSARRTRRRY